MNGELVPDADHVARYCKPSTIDDAGLPMATAFKPRKDEQYLSVNWLEYFGTRVTSIAVQHVRDVFRDKSYQLRSAGRIAVINVGECREVVHEAVGKRLRIDRQPLEDDQSHAGIHGYTADDLEVAVEIKFLVERKGVHPAVTQQRS